MKLTTLLPIALLLAAVGTVFAQTANVIELDPADTTRAQKAWDALQKAQAEWDAIRDSTDKKYVKTLKSGPDCISWATTDGRSGCTPTTWGYGFEFSKDFRFIVPKGEPPRATTLGCPQNLSGCISW